MTSRSCLHDAELYCACCHDLVEDIVRRHCPVFQFHKKESYFPSSIEWCAVRSEFRRFLKTRKEEEEYDLLKKTGEVTLEAIQEAQQKYDVDKLQLMPMKDSYTGCKDDLDSVPVYTHVKVVKAADGSAEALELNYMLLYPYNGPHPIMGSVAINVMDLGNHAGDWEHLTVRCEPADGKLIAVWYNTHRNRDGQWIPAAKVPKTEDGRILVYVALHSHGSWPAVGVQWRVLGVVNDLTDDKGVLWRPAKCINVTPVMSGLARDGKGYQVPACESRGSTVGCECMEIAHNDEIAVTEEGAEWMQFRGYYGGVRAPCEQRWFKEAEPPVSRTAFERVFEHKKAEILCV